ncbi:hypothetical protein N0V82_009854 [Gnomoniopsis sp. IMI 355080]|nr:hypothetical protein N0V82_009854 [Gnomoniopsis sp. IMI 355080]
MDDSDWDDENHSFTGGLGQYYNGDLYPENGFQQPQYGGQQQHQPLGRQDGQQPLFGQQQQQQYAGQHFQTGSQQQQYNTQQFATVGQQGQGEPFDLGSQPSQVGRFYLGQQPLQYGSQQACIQSDGQHWHSMNAQQPFNSLVGRGFSSNPGDNDHHAPVGFVQAATWASSGQHNVSVRPNAFESFPNGLAETQRTTEELMQFPILVQGLHGQQNSNGYNSRQSSGNSFNQHALSRSRPTDGQSQYISGQQQHMGHSQRIPMAIRPSYGQFQSHFSGGQQQQLSSDQQFSPLASSFQTGGRQQYQGVQSHFMPGQRQSSRSAQQLSPMTPRFQPDLLQQFAAGALNMSSQQVQVMPQTSPIHQHHSASASHFQPGSQNHFANNQPSQPMSQYQDQQHFSQGQIDLNDPNFIPSDEIIQQVSGVYHLQGGRVDTNAQRFGFMQQSIGSACQFLDELSHIEYEAGDEDFRLFPEQVGEEAEVREGEIRQRALQRTAQWLDHNVAEAQHVDNPIPEDMVQDPLYQQTLLQVQEWQEQHNVPMTQDQQACLAAQETWKKKDNIKGGKRLAELDEDDLGDDIIEEAVRDAKRQRIRHEHLNFHANAQKVYLQGPENRPEPMDTDNSSADDNQVTSFDLDLEILGLTTEFKGEFSGQSLSLADNPFKKPYEHQIFDRNFRLIESICCDWTFMIEVTKHLRVKDIIMLYSVSKTFHNLVNLRFQSTIAAWAQEISPSGWKVFYWKFYGNLSMKDPAGKPWAMPGPVPIPRAPWARPSRVVSRTHVVRSVPSLKYLAMIAQREKHTRDILACLARAGHRLPETMHVTLKKIWMLMDISTNNLRRSFIRNEKIWTPRDLYNAQMFYVKLQMRFNEPIFGPKSTVLADTFLGLRDGLNPLWRLLRRKGYLEGEEILQQRLKYYCRESVVQHHLLVGSTYVGVHPNELGNEHKEGWGSGNIHLSRPDELVVEESVRRNLHLEKHIVFMMFWGHVDWKKRLNLVPTEDEMYMSDDELPSLPKTGKYAAHSMWGKCGNVPFEFDSWQPKHSMKARWKTLTREEKLAIIKNDEDEQMRALPFEKDVGEKFWDLPYNANDKAHPDYPGGEPANREEQEQESDDFDLDTEMGEADDEDTDSLDSFVADGIDDDLQRQNREQSMDSSSAEGEEGSGIVQYEFVYEDESLPMPDTIEDEEIIANWDELDPYLQQKIIEEQERVRRQDEKDERTLAIIVNDECEQSTRAKKALAIKDEANIHGNGESFTAASDPSPYTSPMKKQPKRYKYPGITDPISLALLERYDRFAPEEFRTDENGIILGGEQASSGSSNSPACSIELSDYDDYDDEDLKALADEEYDSDQVDFDLDSYQKFLERVGDDGGFRDPDAAGEGEGKGQGKAKAKPKSKKDVKGKGKAVAVESSDDEDDYDRDEMAHEGDLDDDVPLPKYDFRKF